MAQTIIIPKGNRQLQDVEKVHPDTKVNLNAAKDFEKPLKYPFADFRKNEGVTATTFTEDSVDFTNPHEYENPDADEGD